MKPSAAIGYFIISHALTDSFQLWIAIEVCVTTWKIPAKTVDNGCCLYRKRKSKYWMSYFDGSRWWIRYDTIPKNTLGRKKLPVSPSAAYDILRANEFLAEELYHDHQFKTLQQDIESYYQNRFPPYVKNYIGLFQKNEDRIAYAKTHALFERIIFHLKNNDPPAAIFAAYKNIMYKELASGQEMIFKTENHRSFWRKIKGGLNHGIKETIIHSSKKVARPERQKLTDPIRAYIRKLFRHPQRLTYRVITGRVNRKFQTQIDISSIKKMATPETKNLTNFYSKGTLYARANSLPRLSRELATSPGELYQGDYYKLQFYIRHSTEDIGTMTSYFVLDVFSRKIVGWAADIEADQFTALRAYQMAFTECGFMPNEISVDNDVRYAKKEFKYFIEATQSMGVTWTQGNPHSPTFRAEIESFFSKFQKVYCSGLKYYQGEGLGSRNLRGNPAKEFLQNYKVRDLPTADDLILQMRKLVEKYNYEDETI